MNILDDQKQIQKLQRLPVLESVRQLSNQCQQAYLEASQVKLPKSYKKIKNVVINGMGASGLGGHILKSLYKDKITVPVEVINSYTLPAYVNNQTLYLASSYSGTTEEVVTSLKEAKKKKAKIMGLTTGGSLATFLKKNKLPGFVFKPKFNPSGQPRMGVGYSVVGQLTLLNKIGLLKFPKSDLQNIVQVLEQNKQLFDFETGVKKNPAKQLALALKDKISIIVAAEHLAGNAHTLANQINESSKNFSCYFLIPELNHHLLEGLVKPPANKNLTFIFLESSLYLPKNQKRIKITKQVLKKNKIRHVSFQVSPSSRLKQAFGTLLFGSYLSLYLSLLNGVNPVTIPFVDYFKRELIK